MKKPITQEAQLFAEMRFQSDSFDPNLFSSERKFVSSVFAKKMNDQFAASAYLLKKEFAVDFDYPLDESSLRTIYRSAAILILTSFWTLWGSKYGVRFSVAG